MSKYTTEVRFICETMAGLTQSQGYRSVNDILNKAAPLVFDFDFPIFDESYRSVLEKKILKHFYTREIGLETVGLWKLKLDTKMNEIMPFYNQLYKSELLEFNPLYDVDLTTTHTGTRNETENLAGTDTKTRTESGNKNSTGTGSENVSDSGSTDMQATESRGIDTTGESGTDGTTNSTNAVDNTSNMAHMDLYSDTPQGGVDGLVTNKYLTNARKVDDTNTEKGSSTVTGSTGSTEHHSENSLEDVSKDSTTTTKNTTTKNSGNSSNETYDENASENGSYGHDKKVDTIDDYLEKVSGKTQGASYSKMLMEFRQTFLNIDMLVIGELEELFMQLW